MPVGALRAIGLSTNLAVHGVAITITRPAPDQIPVITTGIWLRPLSQLDLPVGTDLGRLEPRRILVIPRTAVTTMPRGTLILAPDERDDTDRLWRVEGFDLVESDYWQVVVLAAN